MYTQKQLEELAKSAHTVLRDKDGKITRLVRCVGGKQEEIVYTPANKKGGNAPKEVKDAINQKTPTRGQD